MTPLDNKQAIRNPKDKNKWWLVILAAILVFVLLISGVWLALGRSTSSGAAGNSSLYSEVLLEAMSSGASFPASVDTSPADMASAANQGLSSSAFSGTSSSISGNGDRNGENSRPGNLTDSGSVNIHTDSSAPASHTVSQEATTSNYVNSAGQSPASSAEPSPAAVTYTYRDAKSGDDYYVHANLENTVVITGVSTVSESGEYVIPETIDGKSVIAIMGNAFNDKQIRDTVKKVVVPANVKTIWDHAFSMCYNLTDIYFCGDAIYTSPYAFALASRRTGTLTIHCSADCTDRNFRYYKNCAPGSYDAVYEEWNG